MTTTEILSAEREIHRALIRVARAMDERDWQSLEAIMTEDMTADLGTGHIAGRAAVVVCLRSFLDDCGPTQHLLGNVLIDVTNDRAISKAYVSDLHLGCNEKSALTFKTLGDYHDQWQKRDGTWRMSHRTKINHGYVGSLEVLGSGPRGKRGPGETNNA
ncbi:MAG: nuclear transport factor 2 family protein [Gammaproteobacteria bacterium]|nr:nuclear transport factor 2 family protein [Gammaproteobacteria bacterium]MDH3371860.1 nuclear transport factor 2 family protein [Gammaproteobacteria bacterium]MDH3407811.1 nuclear transport factor 2 family protein [Gammaproteobacteria bacterium]MDH3551158.1 nuclear transport factor 2 family protein [Gammaproteobacteria bacterium]